MKVESSVATAMAEACMKAGIVPFLIGSPGTGKSSIVKDIANRYGLELIDVRLSQCEPMELNGLVSVTNGRTRYNPMSQFPLADAVPPDGKNAWLLFLDELNSAPRAVIAACYKLILDRMVGQHLLHPKVVIMCAGNTAFDNAIVEDIGTAMQSRLCTIEVRPNADDWLDWAYKNKLDFRITSFVGFKPTVLDSFNPNHTDHTFCCQRTLEFAHKLLQQNPPKEILLPLLVGTIGEGIARELVSFIEVSNSLPKLSHILANPTTATVPTDMSVLFALTGCMSEFADKDNIVAMMQFIHRTGLDTQTIFLRSLIKKHKSMITHPAVQQWIKDNKHELF